MTSPSLTLFVTNVHRLGLMFSFTTLPGRVTYLCSWPAIALVVGSGGLMTGIGEFLVMATSLASSTCCPGCPPSWSLGVEWFTGGPCVFAWSLNAVSGLSWDLVRRCTVPVVFDLTVGSRCTSWSLDCSWLPCLGMRVIQADVLVVI